MKEEEEIMTNCECCGEELPVGDTYMCETCGLDILCGICINDHPGCKNPKAIDIS